MAVTAGVVGQPLVVALVTSFHVAAQGRGTAMLNGPHDPPVAYRQAVSLPVRRAVGAEDLAQVWLAGHLLLPGQRVCQVSWPIPGTGQPGQVAVGNVEVDGGGLQTAMAKQAPDVGDVGTPIQQVGRKAVA